MATAEELLAATSETAEVITIDLDTRVIVIPTAISVLGVESDDDVKRLHFSMPRYYGELDLSEFDIRVNFENARGKGDLYPVPDKTISDSGDIITFTWLVDRTAFTYSGDVTFSVCLRKFNDEGVVERELNTTIATLPVLKGLETDEAIVENNPGVFNTVLHRLYAVEAATGLGQNGYYNVIKVDETDDGVVFTIVDQDGETIATVNHGHTPVYGEDYFTEAERDEFETAVTANVNSYVDTWSPKQLMVTLIPTGWNGNKQVVTVSQLTASKAESLVIVTPEPSSANKEAYNDYGICCVEQNGTLLTFQCDSVPNKNINVNIAIFYTTNLSA